MLSCSAAYKQRGIALLLLVFVLAIGATTLFLASWSSTQEKQRQEWKAQLALREAKEALLAWSVAYYKTPNPPSPGRLPCPEDITLIGTPNEGRAQSSCNSATVLAGRLPWKTLGLDRPGGNEPLWYILSPGFQNSPINSNSIGQIQLSGNPNAIVALIIDPGQPLAGQNRSAVTAATPPDIRNYLDGTNNDGDSTYSLSAATDSFNDRGIVLTQAELIAAVAKRVLSEVRGLDNKNPNPPQNGLRYYYNVNGQFPWADGNGDGTADVNIATGMLPYNDLSFTDTFTWNLLNDNGWLPLVGYTRLSANSAVISIGTTQLKVMPCPTSPCP